jgi:hypothetical protein
MEKIGDCIAFLHSDALVRLWSLMGVTRLCREAFANPSPLGSQRKTHSQLFITSVKLYMFNNIGVASAASISPQYYTKVYPTIVSEEVI